MRMRARHIAVYLLIAAACCIPVARSGRQQPMPDERPTRVGLLFMGDLMQHTPQINAARRESGFDYGEMFRYLHHRLDAADIVAVNLETTLTRNTRYTGYPCFRSPAALADELNAAGVDVALLANNHCCDGGRAGVHTTIAELERCGIRHTGVFADSADYAQNNPLRIERYGVRFAILNYTYGTNGMPVPQGTLVNLIDTVQMAADLTVARSENPDCIAVCIHWGNEYELKENAHQRYLAGFLKKHGANLVIGSHPHVVQPYDADSSSVVLYSLGNFVSNQRKRYCDGGLVARIDAAKHTDGHMTYTLDAVPVWVSLPHYSVIPPEVGDTMAMPEAYGVFRDDVAGILSR